MKTTHRYVEVSYDLGEDTSRFMAVLTVADSPEQAVEDAAAHVRRRHPDATNIEEFMQRTVTEDKVAAIRRQFDNRTWEGWALG